MATGKGFSSRIFLNMWWQLVFLLWNLSELNWRWTSFFFVWTFNIKNILIQSICQLRTWFMQFLHFMYCALERVMCISHFM
jgi:hypothetical protein